MTMRELEHIMQEKHDLLEFDSINQRGRLVYFLLLYLQAYFFL